MFHTLRRSVWMLWAAAVMALAWRPAQAATTDEVVLIQSLPMSGYGYSTASRIQAGALAAVDRENANGGIQGRPLRLVTLDDGGDPTRLGRELRSAITRERAVAVVNCVDDLLCQEAAQAATATGVMLFGPLSGAEGLSKMSAVLTLRPGYAREAAAIAAQLRATGIGKVSVLSEAGEGAQRAAAMLAALAKVGIQAGDFRIKQGSPSGVVETLTEALLSAPKAVIFALGVKTIDALSTLPQEVEAQLPTTLMTFSSPGVTHLSRLFRNRLLGFSSVVPNPEVSQLPLVLELQADSEKYSGPQGITFEGLEAYLNVRAAAEFLRRRGRASSAVKPNILEAAQQTGAMTIGGFRLDFSRAPQAASDWIDIGFRSRDGVFRR